MSRCDRERVSHVGLGGKSVPDRGTRKDGEHYCKMALQMESVDRRADWGLEHLAKGLGLILATRSQKLAPIDTVESVGAT